MKKTSPFVKKKSSLKRPPSMKKTSPFVKKTCVRGILETYLGYIRERGMPERINRTALGTMVAPGPLGNAIVFMLFPRRPPLPSSGGIGSAGPGEKNLGGQIPAQQRRGRFPIKWCRGARSPPSQLAQSMNIEENRQTKSGNTRRTS